MAPLTEVELEEEKEVGRLLKKVKASEVAMGSWTATEMGRSLE
jgi:hypothetical protein